MGTACSDGWAGDFPAALLPRAKAAGHPLGSPQRKLPGTVLLSLSGQLLPVSKTWAVSVELGAKPAPSAGISPGPAGVGARAVALGQP